MKTNPILVAAADRSPQAGHVVKYAIDLAVRLKAELHVVYVDVLHEEEIDKRALEQHERFIRERLEERGARELKFTYAIERDITPAPGILRYATNCSADLLILGTHGRRGVRALILGSVAHEVIRLAPCPVFTATGRDEELLDINMISRLLIPVDFSKHAVGALLYAREMARLLNASLDIIHIIEDTFHPAFYGPFHHSIYDINPEIEEVSRRNITRLLERTGGIPLRSRIEVFRGHPARDIADWATSHGSELIVMATHGLTGMQHLFMGSVAERTVQLAPCPVLTIHVDLLPHVEQEIMEEFEVAVV